MAESSGSLKPSNSLSHVNGKMNGHTAGGKRPGPKGRSFVGWLFNITARLTTWAVILTILFWCPSTLEECNESSPFICQYYFKAKTAISPYTQPYYDQYLEPYAEFVKPYYEAADTHVLTPTRVIAVQYGAPWVKKGQDHALTHWEKHGRPRVEQLRALSQEKYDQTIAPYLTQAGEVVAPYYEIGRTNSLQLFYEFLVPTYEFVQPYALQGYNAASSFTTGTALPAAHWTWNKTNTFLDKAVWPQVRVIYLENVEPQLVRIGERLERYKNRARTKVLPDVTPTDKRSPASEAPHSTFSKPAPQSTSSSLTTVPSEHPASVAKAIAEETAESTYWNPVQAPPPGENESEQRRIAREMVAQDLEMWQNKFAAQADEGANDMEDRVDDIASDMMQNEAAGTGKSLVLNLERTVNSETESLKLKISKIIAESAGDDVEGQLIAAIRSAGMTIKKAAQSIRSWREDYDEDLQNTVLGAADGHFAILDETRSLALTQLGMKWAWTDGVTYKDWAKYHELKSALTLWTEELKQLIVSHPTLLKAQDAAAQVEDDGMIIATAAAKELARLKQVALWKLVANDATDNFDSEAMKLAAEAENGDDATIKGDSAVVEGATEATPSASSSTAAEKETMEQVASIVSESASEATSSILGTAESIFDEQMQKPLNLKSESETSSVVDIETETTSKPSNEIPKLHGEGDKIIDEITEVSETLNDLVADLTSVTVDETLKPEPEGELPTSLATGESTERLIVVDYATDEDLRKVEGEPPSSDQEEEILDSLEEKPVTNTASVKPALFGAAAQAVSNRQPVLDEDEDTDNFLSSATNAAEAAYSSAVSIASGQFSSAASIISAQVYGTPEPVHDQLFASVSAAYTNAVAAASSRLGDVLNAASSGIYGTPTTATPTPTPLDWSKVESIAAERFNEGKLWAELRYQSALIAMGLATPTPTSTGYYEQAKYNYYAGLGLAHDRYSSFVSAASSAWSSVTATPTPTTALKDSALSMASAAGQSVASAVHAAGENVKSAVEAVDESIAAVQDAAAEQVYLAGVAIAETWENVISQISAQVYSEPTQIGWYDNLGKQASATAATATEVVAGAIRTASADAAKHYESVSELVSELIVGKEPSFTESVLSRLSAAYATAVGSVESLASEASAAAGSVGQKVGSMMSKATETAKEGKDEL